MLSWNFFRLIQTDRCVLNILALISIASFLFYISEEFIIFFLIAIKIAAFLLIFSFLLSFFYPQMGNLTKISFVSFLMLLLSLGLFLGLVKLYFFNAVVFFSSNHTDDLLFSDLPKSVYLSLKNYELLSIQKDSLFILDFSSDTELSDFSVQLGKFNQTKYLFNYVFQLLCLDASWFPFHFTFVFTK